MGTVSSIQRRVKDLLDLFELADRADGKVGGYNQGLK